MMSVLRSVRTAKVTLFKPSIYAGPFAMIHNSKLVDLHETLHQTKKEQEVNLRGLRFHTCPGKEPCITCTGTINKIAEQLQESKMGKQTTNVPATCSAKNKNKRPSLKTLEAAVTGVNPFTGKKMTNAEMEQAFGL